MTLKTLVVLITSAKPGDVKNVSTVSMMIVEFLTMTHHATAGDPLDVGFQE